MASQSVPAGTDLSLRPAEVADARPLAELFIAARRAAEPAMPAPAHSQDSIHAWFTELLEGQRETWVAEREGDLVGYLVLDPAWLDSVYVHPELTGQGIGTVLLDLAKSLRPDGFALWVFRTNVRAQQFYRRHGLLALESTDGDGNEEKAPDVRMAWPGARPTEFLRRQIDEVDTELGRLLARRSALTSAVQRHKEVPGQQGRDRAREAEIVAMMAERAPALGPERIARIMDTVITESLDAAASE